MQHPEAPAHNRQPRTRLERLVDAHRHQIRQRIRGARLIGPVNLMRLPAVARAAAVRTGDLHVRQKLHVETDRPGAVAGRTAQRSRVIGKGTGLQVLLFRFVRPGKGFPQLIVYIGVGRHRRPDVDADRRRVNQPDLPDAVRLYILYMRRQRFSFGSRLQSRNQALQHQRRLPGAGNARDNRQLPFRKSDMERLYRVQGAHLHLNRPGVKQLRLRRAHPHIHPGLIRKERPDHRLLIFLQIFDCPLRDHAAAAGTRLRPHLDHPVGMPQNAGIVIDQHHRVAVRYQIIHHAGQPLDIGRMQADRRLIQHVEHTGCAVAHGAGKLHTLPLPCRKSRRGPVQGKIA